MPPAARTKTPAGSGWLLVAAGALLAAGCNRSSAPSPSPAPDRPVSAAFKSIEGAVDVKPWGELEWRRATLALPLRADDLIKTGPQARAEIRLTEGTEITISPNSLIRVEQSRSATGSERTQPSMSVQAGEINFQTSAGGKDRTTLGTPSVTARVERDSSGSLQVAEGGATGLRLFRGTGEAETKAGQKVVLGPNEGLQVAAEGTAGPKVALPTAPTLVSPSNQTQLTHRDLARGTTVLAWSPVPGAPRYRVVVDYAPTFSRPLHDRKDYPSTQAEVEGLEAGTYCWRVSAVGKDGLEGPPSETWKFTLAKAEVKAAPPPVLEIQTLELNGSVLHVRGRTEPGATLLINDEKVRVEADGTFGEFLAVAAGAPPEVLLKATSRAGGVAELRRRATAGR